MAYSEAPQVETIGRRLITEYHPHLRDTRVEFVFNQKTPMSGGKEVWGKARKMSGINAFLARDAEEGDDEEETFFCIEISRPVWSVLSEEHREALVFHELQHCRLEEKFNEKTGQVTTTLKLHGHDIEEFSSVVERYGLWRQSIQQFVQTALKAQPSLFEAIDKIGADNISVSFAGSAPPPAQIAGFTLEPYANGSGAGFRAVQTETGEVLCDGGEPMFFRSATVAEAYLRGLEVG